ncbi:hypothetical protein D9758_006162 [Tetrapyrgos nigripes]|uniref:Uncharacterized protein n=1 Tax=Tetrapyrgos nigripes TaxID=182062 RepID=A0A8H5LLE4_9AGAR|nr:hypothetical protein D9758_006162 [Tetrapyrgos nigripes]
MPRWYKSYKQLVGSASQPAATTRYYTYYHFIMQFVASILLGMTLFSGAALGSIIDMECLPSQAGSFGCGFSDPDINNGNAFIFQCNGFNFVLFAAARIAAKSTAEQILRSGMNGNTYITEYRVFKQKFRGKQTLTQLNVGFLYLFTSSTTMSLPDREKRSQPPLHPPNSPRRKPNSVLKCCLWIAGVVGLTIGCVFLHFGYLLLVPFYHDTVYPHQSLYQTSAVSNRSSVVQPLISKEQTFDVAVSVWVRGTKEEEKAWRAIQDTGMDDSQRPQTSLFDDNLLNGDQKMLYYPLYSDIPLRGLRLSDKHVAASIDLSVPTQKFRAPTLLETDLLSTFVLIPTSPSLMDFVVNFSSWKPDEVLAKYPLYRTWPFPMGSEYKGEKTIADLALESFGLQAPLIQFHEIPSRCPSTTTPSDEKESDGDEPEPIDPFGSFDFSSFVTNFDDTAMKTKNHPHVTAWSQLRIVEETHIMNREAYNEVHEELKRTSCGQGSFLKPLRGLCGRNYKLTGNIETRLELEVKDEDGSTHTEWAYAPYLISDRYASGPMDLIPVPVHREDCTGKEIQNTIDNSSSTFNLADSDFMNFTWHISFTGRSPAKFELGSYIGSQPTVNHSQSDYQKVQDQDSVELLNSLRGVRKPDAHPRRRIFLSTIENNTVYISIPGTLFLVASEISSALGDLISAKEEELWAFYAFMVLMVLPSVYLKSRTAFRIELVWKGWIPSFSRMQPTHRERASERLDKSTSWTVRLTIFCCSSLFLLLARGDNLQLLPPLHPAVPQEDVDSPPTTAILSTLAEWSSTLFYDLQTPLWLTGISSQIILNHKSRHFAGNFKSAAVLSFVNLSTLLMKYVPAVVGRYNSREALWFHSFLTWGVQVVIVYQAVMFPEVRMVEGDEDEE